jgi:subtilisin family serine protease
VGEGNLDQDCRDRVYSEDYFDLLIEYGRYIGQLQADPNLCYNIINITHAVLYFPIANLPNNFVQIYGYGVVPSCFGLLDLPSLEASGVRRVQNIPALDLRGNGVLIGIIDTGIEYTHSAFIKADGTSKILSIWDQTIISDNPPEGFIYGTEYTREQINAALASEDPLSIVPSVDEIGHGTFLSGIVAGNLDEDNNFGGVVPDADLIVIKLKPAKNNLKNFFEISPDILCYQETDIMQALKYLNDLANKIQRPISIVIGLGTSSGAHDERGSLSSSVSRVADHAGMAVSVAAGNEGTSRLHYLGTISQNEEYNTVELRVGPNEYGFTMELWGDAPNTYSIDILSPSGEYIPRIPARFEESREIRFIFEQTVIIIDYQLVETQTGDELILLRFRSPAEGIWRFRVYASGPLEKRFHIWMPLRNFLTSDTYFPEADPYYTLTSPGNAVVPIVVTAYDISNQSLYLNASRGYNRNNIINPNLAAPGVNVIGPTLNNQYMASSGTSIAAAHTAGVAAILLEWGIVRGNLPLMDSVDIKNFLIRGAKRDPNLTYPNREWGYGILDLYSTFLNLRGDTT